MSACPVRRVLMTGDTVGGVWTFTLELAKGLGEQHIEVTLAAMGGAPSETQEAEAACIPNLRLMGSDRKLEWMDEPWADVAAAGDWLLGLEEEFAPDLVHLNTLAHGALPWKAPVVTTVHSCVASWWKAVKHEPLPVSWSRYREEVSRSLHAVDLVVTPSRTMLDSVHEEYGSGLPESTVVPNGRAGGSDCPAQACILTAGRIWDEAKNIAAVDRIARRLEWPVYVAGEQRHPNGSSAVLENCVALGKLTPQELASWYSRAAIYTLPARYEPFGYTALEAALSRCALVLGDIPSLREIWRNAAIFVPPDDSDALENALTKLISETELRAEFAARAAERARMFTPDRMIAGYLSAYTCVS